MLKPVIVAILWLQIDILISIPDCLMLPYFQKEHVVIDGNSLVLKLQIIGVHFGDPGASSYTAPSLIIFCLCGFELANIRQKSDS